MFRHRTAPRSNRTRLGVIALALLALTACGAPSSPEQQVRAVIESLEAAAEARDVGDLTMHLSEGYRDAYGQGRQEAGRYVRGYFLAHPAIHLMTRIEQIEFPVPEEARVQLLVGMLGREAEASGAWDLAADLYEIDLVLHREGDDWRVGHADWRRR